MPIKPVLLQRRLAEVGRIRIGQRVPTGKGGTRPSKLSTLRFTSASRPLVEKVAAAYGGDVAEWSPSKGAPAQWEVITEAARVPVIVPPSPYTQWMELWSGGGCARRCDGETMADGQPCACSADDDLKCKPTTRISVMLRDIEGLGCWRLESHGWNAASDLPNLLEFLERAGSYVEAFLYLKPVRQIKDGQTKDFMVPGLDVVGLTPGELRAGTGRAEVGAGQERQALGAGGRDYLTEIAAATSREQVVEVWQAAKQAGTAQGPVVEAAAKARVAAILDRVADEAGETGSAVDPSVDEVWAQIVAAWPGDRTDEIEEAFAQRNAGEAPSTATVEQLVVFLAAVRAGEIKAAAESDKVPF
jgi:hypothetical protein